MAVIFALLLIGVWYYRYYQQKKSVKPKDETNHFVEHDAGGDVKLKHNMPPTFELSPSDLITMDQVYEDRPDLNLTEFGRGVSITHRETESMRSSNRFDLPQPGQVTAVSFSRAINISQSSRNGATKPPIAKSASDSTTRTTGVMSETWTFMKNVLGIPKSTDDGNRSIN